MTAGAFILSVVFAASLVGSARRVALRTGVVAEANPIVSDHVVPVPLLGGTAAFIAFLTVALIHVASTNATLSAWDLARLVGVAGFILVGTVDDCHPLRPLVKLTCQLVVCVLAMSVLGEYGFLELAGAVAFLVLIVNAYNLVDVMDGLLCTIAVPALMAAVVTSGLLPTESKPLLWLGLACICALLLFNRPPAAIYGGDAASLSIGFLVGSAWLEIVPHHEVTTVGAASLLLLVPVAEVILLTAARLRRAAAPYRASPDHFALRLRDQLGWSRYRVLATTFVVVAVYSAAPLVALQSSAMVGHAYLGGCVACTGVLFALCWRLHPVSLR